MKTIAVLTDFSKSAEHATQFALHIAKKMKTKVLLFSVCAIPSAKQLVFAGDPESLPRDEHVLADFGCRMVHHMVACTFPGSWLPEVEIDCDNSEIVDVMTTIMRNEEICMIVTAPPAENDLATYILSDACNRIIDWAAVPVLVVPEVAPLRNFEKIAFASQLHEEDINSVAEVDDLMESFAAELMVTHLNCNPLDTDIRKAAEKLNRDLHKKLHCGGVYFRDVPDVDKKKNWDWLKANKRTDLLAVVQQSREQMAGFFERGRNEAATYHLTLPVIILPKRP